MLVAGSLLHPDGSLLEWAYTRSGAMTVVVTALQAPQGMTIMLTNIDDSRTFATGLNRIEDVLTYLATLTSGSRGVGDLLFATKDGDSLRYVALNLLDRNYGDERHPSLFA